MTGLELLQRTIDGHYPAPPIGERLNFGLTEVSEGRAVFRGLPGERHHFKLHVEELSEIVGGPYRRIGHAFERRIALRKLLHALLDFAARQQCRGACNRAHSVLAEEAGVTGLAHADQLRGLVVDEVVGRARRHQRDSQ